MKRTAVGVLASALAFGPVLAHAQSCSLPPRSLTGDAALDVAKEFTGFIADELVGHAQDAAVKKTMSRYIETIAHQFLDKADGALFDDVVRGAHIPQDRVLTFSTEVGAWADANKWVHVLKAATIARALAAEDYGAIAGWVVEEGVEAGIGKVANAFGATSNALIVGVLFESLKATKASFDTLEHEDCLTNIDTGFYAFLNDPELRWEKPGQSKPSAADYYIENYLRGGGNGPYGAARADNRRVLQCFINVEMPESERIDISYMGPKDSGWDKIRSMLGLGAVTGITDAAEIMASIANPKLRVPVNVMLRDFNARADLMEQSRKLGEMLRSNGEEIEELSVMMQVTAKAGEWLCARLQNAGPDITGNWVGEFVLHGAKPAPLRIDLHIGADGASDGMVSIQGQKLATSVPKVAGKEVSFRLLQQIAEKGLTLDAIDFHFKGEVEPAGETLAGKFNGKMLDMECVIQGMYENDKSKKCGHVPMEGNWQAQRQ